MKKLLFMIILILIMSGCAGQAKEIDNTSRLAPPYLVINEFFVYDETIQGGKMCAEMIEIIYQNKGVTYALSCLKSGMISFVRTTDYKSFTIVEVIEQNLISIDELVKNKIIFIYDDN